MAFVVLAVSALALGAAWAAREPLLGTVGRAVVEDDPLRPVDLGAIVTSTPVPAAEEMAWLVRDGYVPRVVVYHARRPTDDVLDRLGIAAPRPSDLAVLVMLKLHVPADIVSIDRVDDAGTNAEIRALALYMRRRHLTRAVVVADRSHTRRVASLLRSWLGPGGIVVVRAPRSDPYDPDRWWRSRESSRELAMESLRWINSLLLRDWWRVPNSRPLDHGGKQSSAHIMPISLNTQASADASWPTTVNSGHDRNRFLEINPFVIG